MAPVYGQGWPLTIAIISILGIWLALSYRSAKGSSVAADSPLLIASGQFEEAEQRIETVMRFFDFPRGEADERAPSDWCCGTRSTVGGVCAVVPGACSAQRLGPFNHWRGRAI